MSSAFDIDRVFAPLPTLKLARGKHAECPECRADQGDPIEDFFGPGKSKVTDTCGGCGIKLRFVGHSDEAFEVFALQSRKDLKQSHP